MFSVSGRSAKEEMMKSQLPNKVLGKVWRLADTDNDGMLDHEEFALAMHLIKVSILFMCSYLSSITINNIVNPIRSRWRVTICPTLCLLTLCPQARRDPSNDCIFYNNIQHLQWK